MKIVEYNNKQTKIVVDLVVNFLGRGKIVACPTDTIYGLSCLATDRQAVKRIYKIKKRQDGKPFVLLMNSLSMVKKYCRVNCQQAEIIKKQNKNPKSCPTTFILADKGLLPKELNGKTNSLAVRLPKQEFICKILSRVMVPLVSTSLNLSGQPPLEELSRIREYFKPGRPDLVIDAGKLRNKKPSRIIDIRDALNIRVLRK